MLKIAKEPISMETPIGDDEDSHLGDFLDSNNNLSEGAAVGSPVDPATGEVLQEATRGVLAGLTAESQGTAHAFWYRYEYRPHAGRSRQAVRRDPDIRQIEAKALQLASSVGSRSFLDGRQAK